MSISLAKAQQLTSPNPFCLVGSLTESNQTNFMALSWWSYLSNHPATVGICVNHRAATNRNIKRTGEFSLCVVDESLAEAAMKCGTSSGDQVEKAEAYGIVLAKAEQIGAGLVQKSRVALECRVLQCVSLADHDLFLAEVVAVHMEESYRALYAMNGYKELASLPR